MIRTVLQTVSGIVVARIAGPMVLGSVNYGTSFVAVFGIVLGLFGPSHTKMVSEGRNLGDCIKTYGIMQSTLIIIYGIVFAFIFNVKQASINLLGHEQSKVILILFISTFIHNFLNIITGTFGARTELAKQSIPYLVEGLVYNTLRIVVVALGFGAIAIASSTLVATICIVPIILFMFKGYPIGSFDFKLAKLYLGTSIFFFIIHACNLLIQNYGKVYLGNQGSIEQVGIFTGGYSLASMLLLVASTSGTVFFPLFSKMLAVGRSDYVSHQIYRYQRFLLIFVMPIVVVISVFAKQIIDLVLGGKYAASVPVLSIVMISSFIHILMLPFANVLVGAGKLKEAAAVNVSQVAVFMLFLYLLVGKNSLNMGGTGLSYVFLISYTYSFISYYLFSRKVIHFKYLSYLIKYLFLGVLLYCAAFFVGRFFGSKAIVSLIITSFVVMLFWVASYYLKLASSSDLIMLFKLIKPSSSMEYIKQEMKDDIK